MRFSAGVAMRTSDGSMLGGDLASVDRSGVGLGVMVIDVAGNGWAAAREAWRVRSEVDAAVRLEPTAALRHVDGVMSGGRGAVGVAARFDRAGRLSYVGVGDVRAQRWRGGRMDSLRIRAGQLGGVCPTLAEVTEPIEFGDVYVFVTDGVRSGLTIPARAGVTDRSTVDLAQELLSAWAREHDDATCVVVEVAR